MQNSVSSNWATFVPAEIWAPKANFKFAAHDHIADKS